MVAHAAGGARLAGGIAGREPGMARSEAEGGSHAQDRRHHSADHHGRLVPAAALVQLSAARARHPGRLQARRPRGGLCRRHAPVHPGPGGGRPGHRHRRPDVLRRLRRRDRLVLLVHVRAHRRASSQAKEEHPSAVGAAAGPRRSRCSRTGAASSTTARSSRGPIRLADLYKLASRYATRPLKVSVGAGPVNLAWHVYYKHYKDPRELSYALAPIFNAEMKALVAAGANFLQFEDLGAWLPLFTKNNDDFKWIVDVIAAVRRRRRRQDRLALLLWQRLGQSARRPVPGRLRGRPAVLLRTADRPVRARLRQPRHGGHRRAQGPAGGQGGRRSAWSTCAPA